MRHFTTLGKQAAYVITALAALFLSSLSFAQEIQSSQAGPLRPNLGTAATYAVFTGGGAINNTGLTQLTGDVGQDGAYAFNGFPPGTYTGTLNRNNGASALAKGDLLTAWTVEAAVPCDIVLGVGIVDGQSFNPAVYCSGAATTTSGNITFDAHGDGNAIFIVKIGGQLDANVGTHILLANNAVATNIYWFVDGAVNIADNSSFKGIIFARGAITFNGTSSLEGRALVAPSGAIILSSNVINPVFGTGPNNKITVLTPAQGDTIKSGAKNYQITWSGSGIASQKIFEYSLNNGLTWIMIDTITADVFSHNWNVPDTQAASTLLRITDGNKLVGMSGAFTISGKPNSGSIVVTNPAASETIAGGTKNYQINFTAVGTTPQKTLEYSLDGGANWNLIGFMNSDEQTFTWADVPNVATTQALVRITDANGATGTSGQFTITVTSGIGSINSLTLSGLDANNHIANAKTLGISWTFTPDIGTSVKVEISLDGMITWIQVADNNISNPQTSWTTRSTGYYNPVFVRLTSTKGMTRTSAPFSIGSTALVASSNSIGGYTVLNYPNPVKGLTTFSLILPAACDVTLGLTDALGHAVGTIISTHLEAGTYAIPFNATQLVAGIYNYTARAGQIRLAGKMIIIK